jgi:hypothetical protein
MQILESGFTNRMPHRLPFALATALLIVLAAGPARGQAEPSWPQQFQVLPGEAAGFGFVVTQAGAINVQVTTQGAMAKVTLSGPIAQPIQQTGTGSLRLTYIATAADVQKSSIWVVRIAEANPAPLSFNKTQRAVMSGTLTVQHPSGNAQIALAEIQRLKATSVQRAKSPTPVRLPDVVTSRKTAYATLVARQQAAQKQQLLAMIDRRPVSLAAIARPPVSKTSGAAPNAPSVRTAGSGDPSGGKGDAGGAPPSSTPPTPALPQVASLSVKQGQPKDAVLITGSGFGTTQGQVHFIINPQMDKSAPVDYWSDTQILTYVPDTSGVRAFAAGQVYVQAAGGQKSGISPFQFNPTLDYAQIQPAWNEPDKKLDPADLWNDANIAFWHMGAGDLLWHSGDDLFYLTTTLKNGWVVDSVTVLLPETFGLGSNAYNADARVGTSSLYLKIHWWTDPLSSVQYAPIVSIKGPLGLPYR